MSSDPVSEHASELLSNEMAATPTSDEAAAAGSSEAAGPRQA